MIHHLAAIHWRPFKAIVCTAASMLHDTFFSHYFSEKKRSCSRTGNAPACHVEEAKGAVVASDTTLLCTLRAKIVSADYSAQLSVAQ
jgi:hypothetical protein